MNPVVAVIAPGMMGAAVGRRLVDHGVKVLTSLEGRSAETKERAKVAGMAAVGDDEIATSDFILSILPPGDAVALAQRFVPALTASNSKPVYVDCNAVSPPTVERIAAAIAPTGSPFVDAGIIGSPPKPNDAGPRFYASGPQAHRFAKLKEHGLDVRVLDGPMTAASALKMSYAGITKGTTAIASAMLLGAARFGCGEALIAELTESQPEMLARFREGIPRMYDKAYRWVAEMEEISDFLSGNPPSRDIYAAIARLYADLAEAEAEKEPGPDNAVRALARVLGR